MTNGINDDQIEIHRNLVYLVAESQLDRRLRSKIDAEDVVQETLALAYAKINTLPSADDEILVKRWLLAILSNVVVDLRRKHYAKKRDPKLERSIQDSVEASRCAIEGWLIADQTSPSLAAARNEELEQLSEAIKSLPPEMREVVVRRHIKSESIAEIAREIGKSDAAVAGLLRRGLSRLRKSINTDQSPIDSGESK